MATDSGEALEGNSKRPRTERGRRTLRKLLDAAAVEFGEKGFYEASVSGITRRAGVALGSFYTYFDSKDAIFRALVGDMSNSVKDAVRDAVEQPQPALEVERIALESFLRFASEHKEIYRIIDEAEFVDPESYRNHYENTAARILDRLKSGAEKDEIAGEPNEVHAWALMGMNVFLGLRYSVWGDDNWDAGEVARIANAMLAKGIGPD